MYYIEKMKRHILNWIEYCKEHLIRIIFIFLIFMIFTFVLTRFNATFENGEQQIFIGGITISNWSTWLGILSIACAAIWALYEFDKSRISSQQERASEIAKTFSDDLLDKCSILIAVYQNSPLSSIVGNIDSLFSPFEHFTTDELRDITGNDDFPSFYKKEKGKIDFDYIYFRILEKRISVDEEYNKKYSFEVEKNIQKHYSTKDAQRLFILDNSTFPFHFSSLVDEVLNKLEHVCINISSHAAGSIFIYQSLHQIFFDTVNTLAFEISIRNNGKYSDKFYTNIIHVYNEWQKIYKKSRKNEATKKNQNKKILNPKIKTVE